MKELVVEGLPAITPEEHELKEGGYYEGLERSLCAVKPARLIQPS